MAESFWTKKQSCKFSKVDIMKWRPFFDFVCFNGHHILKLWYLSRGWGKYLVFGISQPVYGKDQFPHKISNGHQHNTFFIFQCRCAKVGCDTQMVRFRHWTDFRYSTYLFKGYLRSNRILSDCTTRAWMKSSFVVAVKVKSCSGQKRPVPFVSNQVLFHIAFVHSAG